MGEEGKLISATSSKMDLNVDSKKETTQTFEVSKPSLWSIESPYLYTALTQIIIDGKVADEYTTPFGIRYFNFDPDKGFF